MDTLSRILCILHVLASCPTGATSGMVSKEVSKHGCVLTRAQCEKTLKQLGKGGYIHTEKRDYRTNIRSTYYHINAGTMSDLASIVAVWNETQKQLTLAI